MLADAYLPPGLELPGEPVEINGVGFLAVRWSPEALARLADGLAAGGAELAAVPAEALLGAWSGTVEAFLDPASPERAALAPALARLCRLSPEGLDAGLGAVLGGVGRGSGERLLAEAGRYPTAAPVAGTTVGPVVVALAANLPGLAVQPLLAALALRRPVLLKSPSAEPLFAPAFCAALAAREPRLAPGLAAACWPGGDERLEAPVLARAGKVLAYGEERTIADLERRAPGKVLGYGPKTSLAVMGAGAEPAGIAAGLARDVALFDQRGCLSVAAVFTAGDAVTLAGALAAALAEQARLWPPGPADPAVLAAVQQARLEAAMRGLVRPDLPGLPPAAGTVIVEPEPRFRPSPGLRTVRIHPIRKASAVPALLAAWRGRLQGAALAGADALALRQELEELGISRCAPPGELQSPDALWHNGGVHPLAALAG